MNNDLILFQIGQIILVIISGYLIILGIGVAIQRINKLLIKTYEMKIEKKKLKNQYKYEIDEIYKVEPNEENI